MAPVKRAQGPGGKWMGTLCSLAKKVKSSLPSALREVPWLGVEAVIETLGAVTNPLFWREEEIPTSRSRCMVVETASNGRYLNFIHFGGQD